MQEGKERRVEGVVEWGKEIERMFYNGRNVLAVRL